MQKTSIEWARNPDGSQGYTWNPITGCLNGCEYCYARKLANARLKERYCFNLNVAPQAKGSYADTTQAPGTFRRWLTGDYANPFYPRFWTGRLNIRRKYDFGDCRNRIAPRGIFCCDMSDLFGIGIPEDWTWKVIHEIRENPGDRFYLLTKQPQNLIKFSLFPDNCFVGVSITDMPMLNIAVNTLPFVKARIKYLSFEPLLSWECPNSELSFVFEDAGISWAIIGAMTFRGSVIGHYPQLTPMKYGRLDTLQPKIEWVQEIVKAADVAGIPVFLKDNLKPLLQQNDHNVYSYPEWAGTQFAVTGDHSLSPVNPHPNEAMRKLRQEMPNV